MIISLYPDENYYFGPCGEIEDLPGDASPEEIEQRDLFDSFNVEMDLYLRLSQSAWGEISDDELKKFTVYFNEKDQELSRRLLIYDLSEETLSLLILTYGESN